MSTTIRPDISKNSKYWIPHYRYLELKNYCRQYNDWRKQYKDLGLAYPNSTEHKFEEFKVTDKVNDIALKRLEIRDKMLQIETTAREADLELWVYILIAVTNGLSYEYLRCNKNIPCGKDYYYDKYRKFFWLLSEKRK